MVKPMTLEETFASARKTGMDIKTVWVEERFMNSFTGEFDYTTTNLRVLTISEDIDGTEMFCDLNFPDDCDEFYPEYYGKTWRCWRYEDRPDWNTRNNTPWEGDK